MKIFRFIILLLFLIIAYKIQAQEKEKISLSFSNTDLAVIMQSIEKQTDYSFVYGQNIPLDTKKSITGQKSLEECLKNLFSETGISWKISGRHIILNKEARRVILSGFIFDGKTRESLIGASISEISTLKNAITNDYGYFTLSLPEGQQQIRISYVGYQPVHLSLSLQKDTALSIALQPNAWLQEVLVTDKYNKPFSPSSGSIDLSMEDIQYTPSLFGETDVLKVLQLLPGVQSGAEGSAGIYVRGGGPDQNLTLLDGVNVYNTNHFYGLFSIFNGDAVKKVTLYKGSFPARFGGRLSSVIDVRLKDGDMQAYHGNISIGLLSSRLNIEGPIIKDRTSFNFSARRSYIDFFTRAIDALTDEFVPIIYFYDLNAKINHKFDARNRLYVSLYNGKDKVGSVNEDKYYGYEKDEMDYHWSNLVGSIRWNHIFNNKLFVNTTAAYNRYQFDFNTSNENASSFNGTELYAYKYANYQHSGIEDWSLNSDFEYFPDDKYKIRFGGSYIFHTFKPEVHGTKQYETEEGQVIKNIDKSYLSENITGNEFSTYLENEFSLTRQLSLNAGAQFSWFNVQNKNYYSLQPRISLGYELSRHLSFKASYSMMTQYIHLLSSSALSMPTDIWVPVTADISPMRSSQFTLGAFYDTQTGYNFSIEGFYKKMNNLLEYKDGASWGTSTTPWYQQVEAGEGWSYGVELFAQKTMHKFTGWLGYTLSWNDRQFSQINAGKRYAAKYDRRHDLKLNLCYKLNERWDFAAAFTLASGNNYTLPLEAYPTYPLGEIPVDFSAPQWIEHTDTRNNFKMPINHHLDLSVNYYRKKSPKGRQASWNFSIYNVYNSILPIVVYPAYNYQKERMVVEQYSLFPILPSVTYTYKF